MKLIQHSNGMVIAFGFDMIKRCAAPRMICWSDIDGVTWDLTAANMAGSMEMPMTVAPEFVRSISNTCVVAYQPGTCIEMTFTGGPLIWSFGILQSEHQAAFFRFAA